MFEISSNVSFIIFMIKDVLDNISNGWNLDIYNQNLKGIWMKSTLNFPPLYNIDVGNPIKFGL